jgi:hypothetical protein
LFCPPNAAVIYARFYAVGNIWFEHEKPMEFFLLQQKQNGASTHFAGESHRKKSLSP